VLLALHLVVGVLFMAVSLVEAGWAYVAHRRRSPLPPGYWRLLRGSAGLIAWQIVTGVTFIALGRYPRDGLHFMYAALVTATVAACELFRPTASLGRILRDEQRFPEAGVYAGLTLLAALFALRLWMTG
jgi:hypothetical protein